MTRATSPRRRTAAGVALTLVVVAGLVVATQVPDPVGDVGGDVLYAAAAYALAVLVLPRARTVVVAGLALGWCWAVEALQATGLAAALNDEVPPAAWLLGSTFAVRDLVCYAAGVGLALAADATIRRSGVARTGATAGRPRT
ncbi:DUF2809 domain-containing protein [Cellulosimicrobium sp. CUA-896]|uniref:ribosomal maturation YjgA family protein n=1 Tax=Cellulosimicrobium sp. CUA-896 TaxID=1517881 RepID=UPI00095B7F0A|nr:DUF2809 domain-containing protein [Cellulosimicrobium sp. CUA-896]OLT50432.1 hypothetical protein BJF88_15455 [Cellulosimicrobium sp. CUA-896]